MVWPFPVIALAAAGLITLLERKVLAWMLSHVLRDDLPTG